MYSLGGVLVMNNNECMYSVYSYVLIHLHLVEHIYTNAITFFNI